MIPLIYEWLPGAILFIRIWFLAPHSISRIEQSRKSALRAKNLFGGNEGIPSECNLSIFVDSPVRNNAMWFLPLVLIWILFGNNLFNQYCSRISFSNFFLSMGFKYYRVDYIVKDVVEYGMSLT